MHRRDNGQPIRDELNKAGLSIPRLAARTKEIDPAGAGISQALVGFYASPGTSGRDSASTRTAQLIASALEVPVEELFTDHDRHVSTSHDLRLREKGETL